MDQSTAAPPDLSAAMKQVEADAKILTAALGGASVRDLSHDQLGELVAAGRRAQARIDAALLAAGVHLPDRGSFVHDLSLIHI